MAQNHFEVYDVYGWLNKYNQGSDSYLGNPVKNLISQVMDAVDKKNYPGAVYYINIAINVSESMGKNLEQAETHFKCGYAYYQMENYIKAITEYRHAKSLYDIVHPHNQAVTNWMLGYALWKTMKHSNAIVVWEKSCKRFEWLHDEALELKKSDEVEWYGEIGAIMCEDLGKAIEAGRWPYQ